MNLLAKSFSWNIDAPKLSIDSSFFYSNNNNVSCSPVLEFYNYTNDAIKRGICPEFISVPIVYGSLAGLWLPFCAVLFILLIWRRNTEPIKSRSPLLLILSLFAFTILSLLILLRYAVGRQLFPCFIFVVVCWFGLPILTIPPFVQLWRLFLLSRLNRLKIFFSTIAKEIEEYEELRRQQPIGTLPIDRNDSSGSTGTTNSTGNVLTQHGSGNNLLKTGSGTNLTKSGSGNNLNGSCNNGSSGLQRKGSGSAPNANEEKDLFLLEDVKLVDEQIIHQNIEKNLKLLSAVKISKKPAKSTSIENLAAESSAALVSTQQQQPSPSMTRSSSAADHMAEQEEIEMTTFGETLQKSLSSQETLDKASNNLLEEEVSLSRRNSNKAIGSLLRIKEKKLKELGIMEGAITASSNNNLVSTSAPNQSPLLITDDPIVVIDAETSSNRSSLNTPTNAFSADAQILIEDAPTSKPSSGIESVSSPKSTRMRSKSDVGHKSPRLISNNSASSSPRLTPRNLSVSKLHALGMFDGSSPRLSVPKLKLDSVSNASSPDLSSTIPMTPKRTKRKALALLLGVEGEDTMREHFEQLTPRSFSHYLRRLKLYQFGISPIAIIMFSAFIFLIHLVCWILLGVIDVITGGPIMGGYYFDFTGGCKLSNVMAVVLVIQVVIHGLLVMVIFLLNCCTSDNYFIKKELLLLAVGWVIFIIVFVLCNFIPSPVTVPALDYIMPFGIIMHLYIAFQTVISILIPVLLSFHKKYRSNRKRKYDEDAEIEQSKREGMEVVLSDVKMRKLFLQFAKKSFAPESILCWQDIAKFKSFKSTKRRQEVAEHIMKTYLKSGAPLELNIPSKKKRISLILKQNNATLFDENSAFPLDLFDHIKRHCEQDLSELFSRFAMSNSEVRAFLLKHNLEQK